MRPKIFYLNLQSTLQLQTWKYHVTSAEHEIDILGAISRTDTNSRIGVQLLVGATGFLRSAQIDSGALPTP